MNLPGFAGGLHPVGQGDIVGPHVKLEPLPPDNSTEDGPSVDPHAHVDILVAVFVKLFDGSYHVQSHLNTITGMILARLRTS